MQNFRVVLHWFSFEFDSNYKNSAKVQNISEIGWEKILRYFMHKLFYVLLARELGIFSDFCTFV
jgi:hypothetical protein